MHVDMSALQALTTEKEMSLNALVISIEGAVLTAYNHTDHALQHARAHLDRQTGEIQIFVPVFSETGERIGEVQDRNESFSRVATATARQAIKQYMRQTKDAQIVGAMFRSLGQDSPQALSCQTIKGPNQIVDIGDQNRPPFTVDGNGTEMSDLPKPRIQGPDDQIHLSDQSIHFQCVATPFKLKQDQCQILRRILKPRKPH